MVVLGTVAGEKDNHHQHLVAVDCEMCYTRNALELTRVTLVGEDEQVLSRSFWSCLSSLCRLGTDRLALLSAGPPR